MIPFPKKKVARDVARSELRILEREYPNPTTALKYRNPFELLIAVILSAQCTDERVNMTTPALFSRYPAPRDLAAAKPHDVEGMIKSCGFFRMKTKSIIGAARALAEQYAGEVPQQREALEALPGVGRKTASVVMANAFAEPALAVDTHVFRVSHRMGLTLGKTPRDVEDDLTALVPKRKWANATHWLILHGRKICKAPVPRCGECPANALCPTPAIIVRANAARKRAR